MQRVQTAPEIQAINGGGYNNIKWTYAANGTPVAQYFDENGVEVSPDAGAASEVAPN